VWRRVVLAVSATLLLASCGTGNGDAGPGPGASEQADRLPAEGHQHHDGHHQHREHNADGARGAVDPGANGPGATPECPERGHGPRPEAPPVSAARLTSASRGALLALARESEPLPCGAIAEWAAHVRGRAHGVAPPERALSRGDATAFADQWSAAVDAAARLSTPDRASAAGYAQASSHVPGVGTHWINWTLVDAPFDPARPSMLLFDETPRPSGRGSGTHVRPARLVGFSYWVRSAGEPAGFAGANDAWHSHLGLCFVRGRLYLEGVPAALACPGTWLNGGDLWMLHAWVVPGLPNPDGRFAPTNPAVP
jgi:hypothetical protein